MTPSMSCLSHNKKCSQHHFWRWISGSYSTSVDFPFQITCLSVSQSLKELERQTYFKRKESQISSIVLTYNFVPIFEHYLVSIDSAISDISATRNVICKTASTNSCNITDVQAGGTWKMQDLSPNPRKVLLHIFSWAYVFFLPTIHKLHS